MSSKPVPVLVGLPGTCASHAGTCSSCASRSACTSFADALTVPQLAEICLKEMTCDLLPGIKILRSVSKGTKEVIHKMIKHFTMRLEGGLGDRHPGLVKFLQRVSLLSLRVEIAAGEERYSSWSQQTAASDGITSLLTSYIRSIAEHLKNVEARV